MPRHKLPADIKKARLCVTVDPNLDKALMMYIEDPGNAITETVRSGVTSTRKPTKSDVISIFMRRGLVPYLQKIHATKHNE